MPSARVGPPSGLMLVVQRVPERGVERRLRADDLDARPPGPRGDGVAGNQPAAADRDHQQVEIGHVLQHFERDRALPGDHARIVVGMHEGEAALLRDRLGAHLRLRNRLAFEHDFGAVGLRRLDLHERRRHRHDDGGGNFQAPGVVGHRLRMVAGRHRDHATRAFGRTQRGELVERATLLERVGDLEVFVFDEHLRAGQRRELGRRQHRRAQYVARDDAARRLDIGDRDRHRPPPAVPTMA